MKIQNGYFNIKQIADSGQCFRMNQIEENKFSLVAYGRYLEIVQTALDTVELSCSEEDYHVLWKDYFDLSYDYENIVKTLMQGEDNFLMEAASYGKGIRILKQEPFEAMISFIISQNKNIPAIKNCIEAICRKFGKRKLNPECGGREYYTFPTAEALAAATKEDLRNLKTGYRDEYIIKASQAVSEGIIDLDDLKNSSYEESVRTLKSIYGIGDKVANCIALYGLHHIGSFPIDIWIKKVLKEIYNDHFDQAKYQGYAGIVQQYMFYYMRHRKGID